MAEFENSGPMKAVVFPSLARFLSKHTKNIKLIYDHGCGYGSWTEYICRISGARASIYDPDHEATKYTIDLLGDRYVQSDGPFDLIMCFGVLELLEREEQVQLLRDFCTKVAGPILVQYNVYNPYSLRWIILRALHGNPVKWHEQHRFHRTYFGMTEVENLFKEAGLNVVDRCAPVIEGHLPRFVNIMLRPFYPLRLCSTIYYALEIRNPAQLKS